MKEFGIGRTFWDNVMIRFEHSYEDLGKRDEDTPDGPPPDNVPEAPPFPSGAEPAPTPYTPPPADPSVSDWTNT
jgi:hypothetical protein